MRISQTFSTGASIIVDSDTVRTPLEDNGGNGEVEVDAMNVRRKAITGVSLERYFPLTGFT